MSQAFDQNYWESHWQQAGPRGPARDIPPNPYLVRETGDLTPGTALDAGCGEGAEAIWLAAEGWTVTAADISSEALSRAAERATRNGVDPERVQWVEADLGAWEPDRPFDLVTTHYAHPATSQLGFYQRISDWVAPGGTLLIVGHLHGHGHDNHPPAEASITTQSITALFDDGRWDIVTAEQCMRTFTDHEDRSVELHDVVLRATRRP